MSETFFEQLEIPEPDVNLGVGSGSHGRQTGEMLIRLEEVLAAEKPDWVMVYGDTNSTLAGALAAVKLHLPVAHVEAGLRSFNRRMPEEHNRVVSDHLSDLLFCPTDNAVENLAREGIVRGAHQVGDVMYDSVLYNAELAKQRSDILARMGLKPGEYALATVHRAENTDDPVRLAGIFQALTSIARDGLRVAAPLHPRTRKKLVASGLDLGNVEVGEPLPYLDMLMLEINAMVIVTDSGGVQKEAYWFGVPCVTVRDETEWVETVESGWNRVVGHEAEAIVSTVRKAEPATARNNAYGDGTASERIAKMLNG
jgi:UDP-N-acetylglucosamine 2-epimerase